MVRGRLNIPPCPPLAFHLPCLVRRTHLGPRHQSQYQRLLLQRRLGMESQDAICEIPASPAADRRSRPEDCRIARRAVERDQKGHRGIRCRWLVTGQPWYHTTPSSQNLHRPAGRRVTSRETVGHSSIGTSKGHTSVSSHALYKTG